MGTTFVTKEQATRASVARLGEGDAAWRKNGVRYAPRSVKDSRIVIEVAFERGTVIDSTTSFRGVLALVPTP
jgi:hypothetical protein